MSATWREDDEEYRVGGVRGAFRSKPRFSFTEVKLLLEAVRRNRFIILRKFNQGVSAEAKKQTWAEITDQINGLGENHREVRQIMKKWADLKCDGKRRIAALRGPNGNNLRKKKLGPVERMVHKILMMSPGGDGDSDLDIGEDDDMSKLYSPRSNPPPYSYLSLTESSHSLPGGLSFDISPMSSPEKELGGDPFHSSPDLDLAEDGEHTMDFDETDDSSLFSSYPPALPPPATTPVDPLPDGALMRIKPLHTYSRNNGQSQNHVQNHNSHRPAPTGPSSSVASTSSGFPPDAASSSAAPHLSQSPTSSNMAASSLPPPASSSTSAAATNSTSVPPPPPSAAASLSSSVASTVTSTPNNPQPPPPSSSAPPPNHTSASNPSDPLPAGASSRRSRDQVAQMASQSLQQQRASRMLLTSVSQSLEMLAQSVQLLVESQQEFVQESLLLQRETVDILRDFSNTALTMLRDKASSGPLVTHHRPASHF